MQTLQTGAGRRARIMKLVQGCDRKYHVANIPASGHDALPGCPKSLWLCRSGDLDITCRSRGIAITLTGPAPAIHKPANEHYSIVLYPLPLFHSGSRARKVVGSAVVLSCWTSPGALSTDNDLATSGMARPCFFLHN